ncbi:hypothetical protein M9H77_09801 [Catharanthus roseus]|uniref:Uncharacterized protein n=1 Tax=Catharanthus roseus TaxID=4058 RepID=A0ACC0C234_CATRO|nr:hypothetical protein M9H77_09801 [Catharanthus roseus]
MVVNCTTNFESQLAEKTEQKYQPMDSNFEVLLEALYTLENSGNLSAPLKAKIQALRLNLRFIAAIFNENENLKCEDGRLEALLIRVQSVCNHKCLETALLLSTALVKTEDHLWQRTMGGLTSTMLVKFELLRPDIKELKSPVKTVMKHVDCCLENIQDLQKYKADSIFPVKEELEAVQERLRFLKNLLVFSAMRSNKISALTLLRIFLGFGSRWSRKIGKLKDLLIHAEILAESIGYLLCLCFFNDKLEDDEMISRMKLQLLSQKQRINRPELPQVRDVYINTLEVSKSISFTSLGVEFDLRFLDSLQEILLELSENKGQTLALLENLRFLECLVVDKKKKYGDIWQEYVHLYDEKTLLIQEAACLVYSLVCDDKMSNFPTTNSQGYINSLLGNLKQLLISKADSIAPFKHHVEAVLDELLVLREDFKLASLWTSFKDVAHLTELLIDSFTAKDGDILWFHKLGLFDVKEEIKKIKEGLNLKVASIPNQIPLQTSVKEELVVFEYEYENIVEQLTNGSEDLQVFSIVGMAGADDKNGSRILLTSRLDNIASQDGSVPECCTYHLSLLPDAKSWEMLRFKLFGKGSCPQELLELGRQIAISCKGLPLTIDLMAGILGEVEAKQDCWLEVAQNFLTEVVNDPHGRCRKALEISYNHLPKSFKALLSLFWSISRGHDHENNKVKITMDCRRLCSNTKRKCGKKFRRCSKDLSRSTGSLGRVKESCIHDVLHDFVRAKAMEEKFMGNKRSNTAEDFPFLEKLVVYSCKYLKELPSCLSDVLTLQRIHLTNCSKSLENSAEKIKDIHFEYGNELVVEKWS